LINGAVDSCLRRNDPPNDVAGKQGERRRDGDGVVKEGTAGSAGGGQMGE